MSLEKLRTARTVAGIHQVCKAVLSGEAETVFIAADVDDRVLGPLLAACREKGIVPDRTATQSSVSGRASMSALRRWLHYGKNAGAAFSYKRSERRQRKEVQYANDQSAHSQEPEEP